MANSKRIDTQLQGITDLTLITPIKPGFVTAFETISHVARLRAVLKTLNALRLGARESSNPPTPFTDVVSRFRIVHSFRWAIIDPRPGSDEPHRLLLNVCFDGGWEPYMRVIWRDLGSMLDLILCHAVDYPLAREHSFERYIRWVRENEISSDFLYLESGLSSSDHEYLAALEQAQRNEPAGGALAATRLRSPSPDEGKPLPTTDKGKFDMALIGLTPLAALYTLERYFLKGQPDGLCLIRAARDILAELVALDTRKLFSLTSTDPRGTPIRLAHGRMLAWFEAAPNVQPLKPRELACAPEQIQAGILTPYPTLEDGRLVMLRIVNRAQAVAWLGSCRFSTEATPAVAHKLYRNVALSLGGLRALGVLEARIDRFPQAFREGMEARAGVLGDLRHNHPKYWKLPQRWPAGDQRTVDLASIHVLIQLRRGPGGAPEGFDPLIAQLEAGSGLQVLAVQPMHRNRNAQGQTQEAFGFVDGISQPAVGAKSGTDWSDDVPRGELLLGHPTRQDACAVPEQPDPLLDNGSFLVVRKLRQDVTTLKAVIDEQAVLHQLQPADLLAKMMGRTLDGTPLAKPGVGAGSNDFNYGQDTEASKCPFHAHIRRSNPREALMPRIARRGMSYGSDDADRGLVFMAYNANLSEQFETLQRWIAGGNSSGGYSGQGDPFLGVAVPGTKRFYRFEQDDGNGQPPRVVHLNLGSKPFVELQWGGYFFAPSITALKNLPALVELPFPTTPATPLRAPALDDAKAWQLWLEDSSTRDLAWSYVRAQPGGVLRCAYGVLVGDAARVMEVFRDRLQRYSVSGYGERMERSVGRGFLGMDEDTGHREQAPAVNAAIEMIGEAEAFSEAYRLAKARLGALADGATKLQQPEAAIDLESLSEFVLAQLCTDWFGLPDGQHMWNEHMPPLPSGGTEPPRCPRGFFAVSRYIFGPQPSPVVEQVGAAKGQALLGAVRDWLATQPTLPPVTQAIVTGLRDLEAQQPGTTARTLTGVILGFPPTVHGNLLSTLAAWNVTKKLWDLQQDWPQPAPAEAYSQAVAVLRPVLLGTMLRQPVPAMVWRRARSAHKLGQVDVTVGEKIVVGITSATQQAPGDHYPIFGGDRHDAVQPAPLHACPGYAMAMGVMLGVAAALLEAGTLRPTLSPTVLSWVKT